MRVKRESESRAEAVSTAGSRKGSWPLQSGVPRMFQRHSTRAGRWYREHFKALEARLGVFVQLAVAHQVVGLADDARGIDAVAGGGDQQRGHAPVEGRGETRRAGLEDAVQAQATAEERIARAQLNQLMGEPLGTHFSLDPAPPAVHPRPARRSVREWDEWDSWGLGDPGC